MASPQSAIAMSNTLKFTARSQELAETILAQSLLEGR